MRAPISALLAFVFITAPITQVLGQAAQPGVRLTPPDPAVFVWTLPTGMLDSLAAARLPSSPVDQPTTALLRVPTLEPNSGAAVLLAPGAVGSRNLTESGPDRAPVAALSGGAKRGIIIGAILVVVAILLFVPCWECLGD
jgi:hypothetical protein